MSECVFLKLGGSVITDKTREATFRPDVARRLAEEIKTALAARDLRLVLGHGAGSFGHFVAHRHATHQGLGGGGGWRGYAETRLSVIRLNLLLLETWMDVGFHPLVVPPSACAVRSGNGEVEFEATVLRHILDAGQVPMVFGDAVLDRTLGFSIASTEDVFAGLAAVLPPRRIILACDVDGVFTSDPARDANARLLPEISAAGHRRASASRAAAEPDVTGRMDGKVEKLAALAARLPAAEIRILSGLKPGAVQAALLGQYDGGTVIRGQ